MEEKHCARCGITKPVTEFSKHSTTKDGLQYYCKTCSSEIYRLIRVGAKPYKSRTNFSIEPLTERKCSKCKVVKPISEFYKNSNEPSGFCYECKECKRVYSARRYHQTHIPVGHPKGIHSGMGKRRMAKRKITKNGGDTCITLHIHSEIMKDDPEHLTTEFMQKILGRKC